ncbi:MAG: phage major capsid protein [Rubrivivax sp.]|jgi:HK97 family phage major capsid protein|nr:phage major capsid protein [Rubrivivax sp.]MBP6319420.1 phage major capsid protein [Rubrivivax sp.]
MLKDHTPSPFGARLGLTQHEVSQFNWHEFVTAAARGDASKLGMVREWSAATAAKLGRDVTGPSSYFIPPDVLDRQQTRDLDKGSTTGAYLVGTTSPTFGEVFRGSSLIDALPMRKLTGLVGDATIPKMTSVSASWFAEGNEAADAAPVAGQVSLTPYTLGAYLVMTHQFRAQTSASASQFIESELARKLGAEVGAALLAGAGNSGQPLTPFATAGVTEQAGASMTWAKAVALLNPCESVGDSSAVRWVVGANAAAVLRQKVRETGQASYIMERNEIAGYPAIVTSNAPTGVLHCANWDAVVFAQWAGIEVAVAPYGRGGTTDFASGMFAIRSTAMVDFCTIAPAALARTTGTMS